MQERALAYFVTHPDVEIDRTVPITAWPLSERGRARMRAMLDLPWASSLTHVFCSEEQKARDGAAIVAEALGLPVTEIAGLGENDRSATGFLPPDEFWQVVEEFFANPETRVRGWEAAADARRRVVAAVQEGLAATASDEPVLFVAHGGVGGLLLSHLKQMPISRDHDQPPAAPGSPPGAGGGHYFSFDRGSRELRSGWQPIDP
jgi:broad specificity phosphatase PhoE